MVNVKIAIEKRKDIFDLSLSRKPTPIYLYLPYCYMMTVDELI
jgi:hypothetical protein